MFSIAKTLKLQLFFLCFGYVACALLGIVKLYTPLSTIAAIIVLIFILVNMADSFFKRCFSLATGAVSTVYFLFFVIPANGFNLLHTIIALGFLTAFLWYLCHASRNNTQSTIENSQKLILFNRLFSFLKL